MLTTLYAIFIRMADSGLRDVRRIVWRVLLRRIFISLGAWLASFSDIWLV